MCTGVPVVSQLQLRQMWIQDTCCYTWIWIWLQLLICFKPCELHSTQSQSFFWSLRLLMEADGQFGLFDSPILSDEEPFGSFYTSDVHTHQSVCFHAQFKRALHKNLTLRSRRSLVLVPVYLEKRKSNNRWNMPSSALGGDMHLFNGILCPLCNWPVLSRNQLK